MYASSFSRWKYSFPFIHRHLWGFILCLMSTLKKKLYTWVGGTGTEIKSDILTQSWGFNGARQWFSLKYSNINFEWWRGLIGKELKFKVLWKTRLNIKLIAISSFIFHLILPGKIDEYFLCGRIFYLISTTTIRDVVFCVVGLL